MKGKHYSFSEKAQLMGRTLLGLGVGTTIGMAIATMLFSTLIWLGYSDAQTTGQPVTFAGIDIYRIADGYGIPNHTNMTWLGIVITGSWIVLVEMLRSIRGRRRLKTTG